MSDKPTLPLEALSLSIIQYVVCSKCADELAALSPPQSLQDYAAIDVGFTDYGIRFGAAAIRQILCILIFKGKNCPPISGAWKPASSGRHFLPVPGKNLAAIRRRHGVDHLQQVTGRLRWRE